MRRPQSAAIPMLPLTLALLAGASAMTGCSSTTPNSRRTPLSVAPLPSPGSSVHAMARANAEHALPPDPFTDPSAPKHWRTAHQRPDFQPYASLFVPARSEPDNEFIMFGELDAPRLSPEPNGRRAAAAQDGAANLRQVSFATEGSDFDPVVTRDGRRVFFSSTAHHTHPDIFVKSVDGRALTQLTTDPGSDVMPAVSPDGARVAFASNRSGSWDIYLMAAGGGQAVQVTGDASDELHPTWSPDGKHIAFCRMGETSGRWEIWVTEADNPGVRRFLTFGLFPDWHPSANKIAFQRSRDRGDRLFSVWTVDFVDGEAMSPTVVASSTTAAIVNPRWSPDGEYIAVATVADASVVRRGQRPDEADIWILRADGNGRANLTNGHHLNLMPSWGPNNALYFVSDRNGSDNIWGTSTTQAMVAAGSIGAGVIDAAGPGRATGAPLASGTSATRAPAEMMPKPALPSWILNPGASVDPEADLPPEMANVPTDTPVDQ